MPDQDDATEAAAERLEHALDRIETLLRRPRPAPDAGIGHHPPAEAITRLDALIVRLANALGETG